MADVTLSSNDLIKRGSETKGFDPRKMSKRTIGLILLALAGLGIYTYILPILLAVAWGTVELLVAAGIGAAIVGVVAAQWRNIGYFNEFLARKAFGMIVEWDPFLIQEKQIKQAEEDVEKMLDERALIEGNRTNLKQKLEKNQKALDIARQAEILAQNKGDEDARQDAIAAQGRATEYLTNITPIVDDLDFIVEFVKEGYIILKRKIKNAKAELENTKDIFESAMAGRDALARMQRAMIGDVKLNSDAERATTAVLKRTAMSIGQMRVSMDVISSVTKDENFQNAAKMAAARAQLQQLNLGSGSNESIPFPISKSNTFKDIVKVQDTRFPID